MDRVILHCDMNNFFASVECKNDPSISSFPVAVCGNSEERHGIVLAKNYEAKKYGIKTGEPTVAAKAKCPFLVTVEPHYDEYAKYSHLARQIYSEYTDLVEPFGDDECWLDVTGSGLLFGGGEKIADTVRKRIKKELGLTVSVGVSFNKVFSKLGSDMKKPDAVTVIKRSDFKEKIWHLDASELIGVGPSTSRTLKSFGIHTIGDLANAYPELLRGKLGKNGIYLKEAANGREYSPVRPSNQGPPMKSIGHGMTTVTDLKTYSEIKSLILALFEDVGHRLIQNGKKAGGVSVSLRDCNFFTRQCQKKLPVCTDSYSVMAREAYDIMKKKLPISCPIRSVSVAAIDVTDASIPSQLDFFTDCSDVLKRERLDRVLDSINVRFGRGKAYYAGAYPDVSGKKAIGFGAGII